MKKQTLINAKNCYTVDTFYKLLESLDNTFDCNKSLMVGKFNIQKKDGTFIRSGTFLDFCEKYNNTFVDKINTKKSFVSGKCFYIFLKEGEEVVNESVEIPEDVIIEDVSVGQVEEEEALVENVDEVKLETAVTPDWDKAGKIKTKIKLEEYARKFEVELNRSNTLTNMLKDFKSNF